MLSGFRGGEAEFDLVFAEELLEFSTFYFIANILLFDTEFVLLEVDAGNCAEVALFRFLPGLLEHLETFLGLLVEEEGEVD